ncbi:centrosomal protein of 68 kDa isoform X2 [Melanotaenia boesemani]|uniref:centrosomal protein of 68 kDa isoform X2 n=1 Tax=Melanotaenia boesemani TaxID=1250792 RepID=UPI001C047646|nr:centrosomal protein of 68 kDa isoform X2 [Melanotaenia boesemani]
MEGHGCSQRWRMHFTTFKKNKRVLDPTLEDKRRETTKSRGDEELQKHVTMASSSRYLTDKHYVMRRPLFSEEQHESILKMTARPSEEENQLNVSIREQSNTMNPSDALIPESFSLSHSPISPPRPPSSSFSVAGQQAQLCCRETTVESTLHRSRLAQQSLSSSILKVQRLNPPLRPALTSTVLYPTYTPRSGSSRLGCTRLRLSAVGDTKLNSPGLGLKGGSGSHQANFWACAIPKALPPSPDRRSASWNPNQEYQALLDYTYPLRPGHVDREWDSSKLQGDALLQTDSNLQDSGIGLDQSNPDCLSGLDFSGCGPMQTRGGRRAGYRSPDFQGFSTSSDSPPSGTPLCHTGPVRFSLDSLDCSRDGGETSPHRRDGDPFQLRAESPSTSRCLIPSTSRSFIRSTSILPRSRCVCGENDEEFWPLPEQLEELQQLSRQVREVTAKLSPPVRASTDSFDRCTMSILSSISLAGKQEEDEEPTKDKEDAHEGNQRRAAHTANRVDSETLRSCCGTRTEPSRGGLTQSSALEVEALVEQLCSSILSDSQGGQEKSSTLMHHVQSFCSHLELLIQQLYAVSKRMDQLAAPAVDEDPVAASPDDYQRVLSHQQPLTSCVLQAGRHLLGCINTTSPFLRDTLLLIERQSGALQTHTDHPDTANTVQSS